MTYNSQHPNFSYNNFTNWHHQYNNSGYLTRSKYLPNCNLRTSHIQLSRSNGFTGMLNFAYNQTAVLLNLCPVGNWSSSDKNPVSYRDIVKMRLPQTTPILITTQQDDKKSSIKHQTTTEIIQASPIKPPLRHKQHTPIVTTITSTQPITYQHISEEQKLLNVVFSTMKEKKTIKINHLDLPTELLQSKTLCFVSLKKHNTGKLIGCMGCIGRKEQKNYNNPLVENVIICTNSAQIKDKRSWLDKNYTLDNVDCEITVMGKPKVSHPETKEVCIKELGSDPTATVCISINGKAGTLIPSVRERYNDRKFIEQLLNKVKSNYDLKKENSELKWENVTLRMYPTLQIIKGPIKH